jgi:hypothetical protein
MRINIKPFQLFSEDPGSWPSAKRKVPTQISPQLRSTSHFLGASQHLLSFQSAPADFALSFHARLRDIDHVIQDIRMTAVSYIYSALWLAEHPFHIAQAYGTALL